MTSTIDSDDIDAPSADEPRARRRRGVGHALLWLGLMLMGLGVVARVFGLFDRSSTLRAAPAVALGEYTHTALAMSVLMAPGLAMLMASFLFAPRERGLGRWPGWTLLAVVVLFPVLVLALTDYQLALQNTLLALHGYLLPTVTLAALTPALAQRRWPRLAGPALAAAALLAVVTARAGSTPVVAVAALDGLAGLMALALAWTARRRPVFESAATARVHQIDS